MIEYLPDTLRIGSFSGTVCCEGADCPERAEVGEQFAEDIGGEELMSLLWDAAGFNEEGRCPICARSEAQEEAADRQRYEEALA